MAEPSARARWTGLAVLVGVAVAFDQVTKQLADAYLRGQGLVTIVEDFVELRYARNPGAFFSLGAELEPTLRRVVFVALSVAAAALIVRLYARATPEQRAFRAGLALLLAGAMGNLVDRVIYGEVIDFVHMHVRDVFDWATYNVADVYIVAGLVLLAVDLFRAEVGSSTTATPSAEGSG